MKLESAIVIEAPAEFVFDYLTNMNNFMEDLPESVVIRMKGDSKKLDTGSEWVATIRRAGRNFKISSIITESERPHRLKIESSSNRLSSEGVLEINPISANSCQLGYQTSLTPNGILGRILIQSIKASGGRIERRIEAYSERIKSHVEAAYRSK